MRRSKTKKLAKEKADKYFSKYIRLRDRNKPCVTCGRYVAEKDAGHYISRKKEATRYDERNINGQCEWCNRFKSGKQYEHGLKIDEMYGKGTAEQLYIKSKMLCRRRQDDYERIAQEYKQKIDEL